MWGRILVFFVVFMCFIRIKKTHKHLKKNIYGFPVTLSFFLASLPFFPSLLSTLVSNFSNLSSNLLIISPNMNSICFCILDSSSSGTPLFFGDTLVEDIISFFLYLHEIVSNKKIIIPRTLVFHINIQAFHSNMLTTPLLFFFFFFTQHCLSLVLKIT